MNRLWELFILWGWGRRVKQKYHLATPGLETKMKLMLAAAMTGVPQKMADNMSFELPSSNSQ